MGQRPQDANLQQAALASSGGGVQPVELLFGIAVFRTRVLARWAAALLAVATTSTFALSVLPESFNRPFAVPMGVALIGLGISLWRDQRRPATASVQQPADVEPPASIEPPADVEPPARADLGPKAALR
jgi:hypothetical protein